MEIKKVCCIGAGYVGGPTMAVIADNCPDIQVTVVDINHDRINQWNSDTLPIFEPGLHDVVMRCRGRNLHFSTDSETAISSSDCVFISVNTPTKNCGIGAGKASDLKFLEISARQIAKFAKGHTIVVEKSTLPVKSAETVKLVLRTLGHGKTFDVLSNPEFLAEGTAINDLLNPDRVLIGGESAVAQQSLVDLYCNWVPREKILTIDLWSSEMAKLAANAFLAQRVSSINSLSAFCEVTGADVQQVAEVIGRDSRIGNKFLKVGPGFGGSCFKKDILNLVYLCEQYGLNDVARYWEHVVKINDWQMNRISRIVVENLFGTVSGKRIAILGFAFKKNTNDTRESPAIKICRDLLSEGANLAVYDPMVSFNRIQEEIGKTDANNLSSITKAECLYSAFESAHAAIIVTDWDDFCNVDWCRVSKLVVKPFWIFDTRRQINSCAVINAGLQYWGIGKGL
jgi:UDPglucose 6-dehydrogenase